MSKKPSLAAALQTFDRASGRRSAVAEGRAPGTATARKEERAGEGRQRFPGPSRIGKKALIGYFDPGVSKQLKRLALDLDLRLRTFSREALNDFFQKHKKPTIA